MSISLVSKYHPADFCSGPTSKSYSTAKSINTVIEIICSCKAVLTSVIKDACRTLRIESSIHKAFITKNLNLLMKDSKRMLHHCPSLTKRAVPQSKTATQVGSQRQGNIRLPTNSSSNRSRCYNRAKWNMDKFRSGMKNCPSSMLSSRPEVMQPYASFIILFKGLQKKRELFNKRRVSKLSGFMR